MDLTDPVNSVTYFPQWATTQLNSYLQLIKYREAHPPPPNVTGNYSSQHWKGLYEQKRLEYWLYAFKAVDAAVEKRLSAIGSVQVRTISYDDPISGGVYKNYCYHVHYDDSYVGGNYTGEVCNCSWDIRNDNGIKAPHSDKDLDQMKAQINGQRNVYVEKVRKETYAILKKQVIDVANSWVDDSVLGEVSQLCSVNGSYNEFVIKNTDGGLFYVENLGAHGYYRYTKITNANNEIAGYNLAERKIYACNGCGSRRLFFVNEKGNVTHIWGNLKNNQWAHQMLTGAGSLSNKTVLVQNEELSVFIPGGGQINIYFANGQNKLNRLWWTGAAWVVKDAMDLNAANCTFNEAGPFRIDSGWHRGILYNYFIDKCKGICQFYYSGGNVVMIESVNKGSTPIKMKALSNEHNDIIYLDDEGYIHRLYIEGNWHDQKALNDIEKHIVSEMVVSTTTNGAFSVYWANEEWDLTGADYDNNQWEDYIFYPAHSICGAAKTGGPVADEQGRIFFIDEKGVINVLYKEDGGLEETSLLDVELNGAFFK